LSANRSSPTLHDKVAAHFEDPATIGLVTVTVTDRDHGRIETRTTTFSHGAGWLTGDRRHLREHRFPGFTSPSA
jgi:hypothetical protein